MSHELRTPLNVILGYSELLEIEQSLDAEQHSYVQEILKGSHHLLMLINQMLDIAPIESGHIALTLHPENISTIIEDCLALVSPLAKQKNINLRYQRDKEIVTLCDRTRLMQLLLNLISNAIKYNVNQGSVEINVVLIDSHHYVINIIDTGQGMPANKLSVIFDPFVRLKTDKEIEGTGLGLSIVQELLVLMGGSIEVKSESGVGSHFWIKMPLLTETDDQIASAITIPSIKQSTYQMPESLYPYRVLYVDDNAANLKLTAKMFRDYSHFQLVTVQDSTLAIAQALQEYPDIILLDINMPEMDGYQVLLALQANELLKAIPVIALSANSRAKDIERGLEAGFSYYLTKPVGKTRLIHTIEQVLGLNEVQV
jgi:CheY-like chemotaxis protein/two-component sensor histidine kinase